MDVNKAFPSAYLKASDLNGRTVTVIISHVVMEAVGQSKEMKPVVYFEGKKKGVVLNRVNSKKIQTITGTPETDLWCGAQIALYATVTEFQGEEVECIRIKAPLPVRPSSVAPVQPVQPVQPVRAVAKPAADVPVEIEPDFGGEGADIDEIPF